MDKQIALITGATSGIGRATAELFAHLKINLILCGRNEKRLSQIAQELDSRTKVETLNFDIRDSTQVFSAFDQLGPEWKAVDILVNCAGMSHEYTQIDQGDLQDWDRTLQTNVNGILYISKAVMPHMVASRRGSIVNIGSIGGKEVFPKGSVYCTSKHAVDALSKAMRIDLARYNIRVTAIHPGIVKTGFAHTRSKGNAAKAEKTYQGIQPLTPLDIAETIWFIITRPAHININEMTIMPLAQPTSTIIYRGES
jgi:NADP-dependent 3-hydroxy acid dehydrogenase YdfG